MPTIAILGTMDTKGTEHGFVADLIRQRGHKVLIIDVGTLEAPKLKPDVTRGCGGGFHWLPRHGELRFTQKRAGEICRSKILPTQSSGHVDAHYTG